MSAPAFSVRLGRHVGVGMIASVTVAAGVLAVPAGASIAAGPATVAKAGTATVNIVHGIPGATVKVCVDGTRVVGGFRFGEKVVGAQLPAGKHRVRVVAAGKGCGTTAILKDAYRLKADRNYTVVASLRPSGNPDLVAFRNRVGMTKADVARLSVRHTAQAPAVNVWAGSTPLIEGTGFTWGEGRTLAVPAGHYRAKVTLPGSRKAVIGPRAMMLRAGNAYQVYAVGAPGNFRFIGVRVHVGTH
jgi:hypothetical protein